MRQWHTQDTYIKWIKGTINDNQTDKTHTYTPYDNFIWHTSNVLTHKCRHKDLKQTQKYTKMRKPHTQNSVTYSPGTWHGNSIHTLIYYHRKKTETSKDSFIHKFEVWAVKSNCKNLSNPNLQDHVSWHRYWHRSKSGNKTCSVACNREFPPSLWNYCISSFSLVTFEANSGQCSSTLKHWSRSFESCDTDCPCAYLHCET